MRNFIAFMLLLVTTIVQSQTIRIDSTRVNTGNAAQNILNRTIDKGITIGGYAEMDYNQVEGDNGKLDVHRLVMLLGYKFSDKVQFVSEIEYEHVKELYVEQAFLNYSVSDNVNLRGGLMLVPMGIVNEYHEPTIFNGVERPSMDKSIVPTTWREIGVGISGKFDNASLRYQAYIFNGFKSVNDTKVLGGSNGLRNGRQKGAESTINTPTFSAKLDYYGILGLKLGLSGYFGKTQPEDDVDMIDGASVGISMVGLDARFAQNKFSARGQFIYASISNTEDYNTLNSTDLGSGLQGWYLEAAYNLLPQNNEQELDVFIRYEDYDTHASVDNITTKNNAYDRTEITFGLGYHIAPGAVVKADYQIKDNALNGADVENQFNLGIGVWF